MKKITWTTTTRKVSSLLQYARNPRSITTKQMSDLKRSLKKFNLAELPAINRDGTLVAGHQRIRALIELGRGDEEIEVRIPNRTLTEAEFKDYLITSNKSGGSWDMEKLKADFSIETLKMAGFDGDELNELFAESFSITDDDTSDEAELAKIKKTSIKQGDKFALGNHVLLCGDSLDPKTVENLMGDVRADMIDIDPPYNINLSYQTGVGSKKQYGGTVDDNKSDEEYSTFIETLMRNALSVAKKDVHLIFWCDERFVWIFQTLYKKLGVNSKRLLIWLKNNATPTPKSAFNKVTEFAVYGTKGSPFLSKSSLNLNEIMNHDMTTGTALAEQVTSTFNVWVSKRLASNQYNHPTEKTASLHEKALKRCTRIGDVVLDLTAGGGSILMACEQLKRVAYCCERESIFCQLIINKFEKLTGIKAKKL